MRRRYEQKRRNGGAATAAATAILCLALCQVSAKVFITHTPEPTETEEVLTLTVSVETPENAPKIPPDRPEATDAPLHTAEVSAPPEGENKAILSSVPLNAETQHAIYGMCGGNAKKFSALMAIAKVESGFTPDAVGDGGRCLGMMQINYHLHTDRINALGVSDLLDPVDSAAVALDYLNDLSATLGVDEDDHTLYMAYNMGLSGARAMFSQGIYSTAYTWAIMDYYDAYMQELSESA